jgi:hypothetical protein
MFKGAALFLLVFVAITPQSRGFIANWVGHTTETLNEWGSLSYVFLAALAGALVVSIVMVKTWPTRADPENPMTKYKKNLPFEE